MVTGTLPFDGQDFKTLAAKVRSGKVAYPSELSNGESIELDDAC